MDARHSGAAVEIRPSAIAGLGLFAARSYRKGDRIRQINVVREVTSAAPLDPELGELAEHCSYPAGKVVLVGYPDRHVNHSCDPNAFQSHEGEVIYSVARRGIEPGEEITYDYNINTAAGSSWQCACGAESCRGTSIGDFFLLPRSVQQRYRPLLADWFVGRHPQLLDGLSPKLDVDPRAALAGAPRTTLDAELQDVLESLVQQVRHVLDDSFVGAYVHGSAALGDFDANSDVDFLIVVRGEVPAREIESVHKQIYELDSRWAKHLEGSYVSVDVLRDLDCGTPLPYFDNGSTELEMSLHDNTLVVRETTRRYGIRLAGPEAAHLIPAIDSDALRAEARDALAGRAQDIRSGRYELDSRWRQAFICLTLCRILHTGETGRVSSKPEAARWARDNLEPEWHSLIARAWHDRPNPSAKARTAADAGAVEATLAFLDMAVARAATW